MFDADRGTAGNRWPMVRMRAQSRTEVVLLSDKFFALTTHFQRVTVPCSGDGCPLCELLPSRGLFYVAVWCEGVVRILELGAASSASFEQHAKFAVGGMRVGDVYELSRRGAKHPIHSEFVRTADTPMHVDLLQLAAHVMALYRFPPPNPADTLSTYDARCRVVAERRNEVAARQLLTSARGGVEVR